ncbi:DUF1800 domain-containing protein [Microvirga lotononidis]|uniref:DUF1800 domain-containing protein n=1 Tax=Microvirga lotononidis TaxID=864069 RepID=I4YWR1_9HYPH|nr:DUF1800 family protein [Microvirga lotononidis]EIM28403.1 hypothetical protein MicloDRAFT_00049860 [Microvirga lotononidis]WQO27513.1 DUF1800 family protein [Microvirga lotononidis]
MIATEAPSTDIAHPALALARFGLGARGNDLAESRSDVRGFLGQDIEQWRSAQSQLQSTPEILGALQQENRRVELARSWRASPYDRQDGALLSRAMDELDTSDRPLPQAEAPKNLIPQDTYRDEVLARAKTVLEARSGFAERMVWFWSNHFAVSTSKSNQVQSIAGAFEREAIRPHVFGRFADMLFAAETHPAMIYYLDNNQSIGPNSNAGQRQRKGLNENLAREILELHTLGVSGGYGQGDVTSLARVITGWTVAGPEGKLGRPGSSIFNVGLHEPGEHRVLGTYYPDYGPDQTRDVFDALARHPSTARHIAFKIARRFVADDPPPALVIRLRDVFLETEGDLAELSRALLDSPEAWTTETRKIRTPQEFVFASLRLIGTPPENLWVVVNPLNALGQKLWDPPGPNGYPDTAGHWATPEGMKTRLYASARLAQRAGRLDPMELLEASLGDYASPETRQVVARAESRQQGVALLLMSPEFQRR